MRVSVYMKEIHEMIITKTVKVFILVWQDLGRPSLYNFMYVQKCIQWAYTTYTITRKSTKLYFHYLRNKKNAQSIGGQ